MATVLDDQICGHNAQHRAISERHSPTDMRRQRSHHALGVGRRATGIEGPIGSRNLLRVGGLEISLLDKAWLLIERAHEQLCA